MALRGAAVSGVDLSIACESKRLDRGSIPSSPCEIGLEHVIKPLLGGGPNEDGRGDSILP